MVLWLIAINFELERRIDELLKKTKIYGKAYEPEPDVFNV